MPKPGVERMRDYWDERARLNAMFYVDTSLDYDHPDLARFFDTGERVVAQALDGRPTPAGTALAVEIGCGLGRMCRALANRFERVVGLDISAEMVARARDLTPDPRISFEVIDGTSLAGLADGSVDLVFSFTVFQHIPDPTIIERYVREAGRVLATGGIFAFQWNSIRHARLWALRRRIRRLLVGLGRANPYGMEAPEFLGSRVPASRMRRWLAEAGLDVAAISGEGQLFTWAWARRS